MSNKQKSPLEELLEMMGVMFDGAPFSSPFPQPPHNQKKQTQGNVHFEYRVFDGTEWRVFTDVPPGFDPFGGMFGPPPKLQENFPMLGLKWPFSEDELKNAYKKAVVQYHPDRGGKHEDMVKLNEENEIAKQLLGK